MKKAFLRLFIISGLTALGAAAIIALLNLAGSLQIYAPLDHPLMTPSAYSPTQNKISYHFAELPNLNPATLKQNMSFSSVTKETATNKPQMVRGYILYLKWVDEDWHLVSAKSQLKLDDFLNNYPTSLLILRVLSSIHLNQLVKKIEKHNFQENVIILANEKRALRELRKLAPRWLYAGHPSDSTKAQLFSSLFLDHLAPFEADFFILTQSAANTPQVNLRLLKELRKRHKKVLLAVTHPDVELPTKYSPFVDGLIIDRHAVLQN